MSDLTQKERLAEKLLEDANDRLRFQHEFTLAGFKTLIYLEGGSIISLLTYVGHNQIPGASHRFSCAIILYSSSIAITVCAYFTAYLSQAELANNSTLEAHRLLGVPSDTKRTSASYRNWGNILVKVGILFSILSLVGFIAGSLSAIHAIG